MPMRYVLPIADGVQTIYCPYHRVWEVYLGEDPALCEWCCMPLPCPMHGDRVGHGGSGLDVYDAQGLGRAFDPFQTEDELSVEERIAQMRSRLERRKAMREEMRANPSDDDSVNDLDAAPSRSATTATEEVSDWIEIDTL